MYYITEFIKSIDKVVYTKEMYGHNKAFFASVKVTNIKNHFDILLSRHISALPRS